MMRRPRSLLVFLTCIIVGPLLYILYKNNEEDWYRAQIPSEIEVSDLVFVDGKSSFTEGCGVAIFKLSDREKKAIASRGIEALYDDHSEFTSQDSDEKAKWNRTPYASTGDGLNIDDRWLGGLSCARLENSVRSTILEALNKPGAFFKKSNEAGVVVIPLVGIAIFIYFG